MAAIIVENQAILQGIAKIKKVELKLIQSKVKKGLLLNTDPAPKNIKKEDTAVTIVIVLTTALGKNVRKN
jgi:hypothetical protein